MSAANEFARIVITTDGRQALFYLEPEGGDWTIHQIIEVDDIQADVKVGFVLKEGASDETEAALKKKAREAFETLATVEVADRLYAHIEQLMEGDA